ncbi:MFS transporter [Rhodococcus fascians]|nr:MFS transporter [Rhodococcus fascians]
MEQQTAVTADAGGQRISVKNIAAGSIGHVMEWFDYAVYAYAAPIIAVLFFPSTDPVTSLLATFAVFAVGFASRPLGALVLGPLGDRIGSTKVLSLSVVIMAIATAFMGILPTYDQIGIWAPVLLVAARLVQGFSVGAEIGSATTFLVEIAPRRRRGFYGSWTHQSTAVGMLLASVAFTLLSLNLSDQALESWGWRVPFLFSIALAFFGFYLRRKLPNTPKFEEVLEEGTVTDSSYREIFVDRYKTMLRVVGIIASFTIGFYFIFSYLPSYTSAFVESSFASAFGANAFGLIFFAIILPFLGMLSDRIGRKPLMLTGYAGFVVMSYPLLTLMNTGTFAAVVIAQLGFVLMLALIAAPLQTALAEIFPTRIRNSSLSISYNVAIALLGGTAPLVATYLSSIADDNRLFLALYLGCAGVISFLTMLGIKDRYRDDLV